MDVVKRNLRALKTEVRRIETAISIYDALTNPITKNQAVVLQKQIEDRSVENQKLLKECSAAAVDDAAYLAEEPEFIAVEEKLLLLLFKITELSATLIPATAAGGAAPRTNEIKLPKLEMPRFSGEAQDWLSFQDLFVASVHNNIKLSGAQKLQYLKGLMKEEPAKLLQHIPITDLNYDQAWDMLKSRYENKREIIKAHIDRLLSLPTLQQENPTSLRKIGDATTECVRALEILKISPEQARDALIVHIVSKKLDSDSRLEWEKSLKPDSVPTVKSFTEFIIHQARVTAAAGIKPKTSTFSKKENSNEKKFISTVHYGTNNEYKSTCVLCQKSKHFLNQCEEFKKMSRQEKSEYVKKNNRCFNCLEVGHRISDCQSKYTCRYCNERHHSSLHINKDKKQDVPKKSKDENEPKAPENEEKVAAAHLSSNIGSGGRPHTLLATALIKVLNNKKEAVVCRALLDNGSQTSFVTKKLATKLGLKQRQSSLPISGLGGTSIDTTNTEVTVQFQSTYTSEKIFVVQAQVMKTVTGTHPSFDIDHSKWSHITGLQLADPKFSEPGNIDILLGADVYEDIVKTKKRKGPEGTPYARDTVLGWILIGAHHHTYKNQKITVHHTACNLNENLNRFWELEEIPEEKLLTNEEKMCEEHFRITHVRELDGRYTVRLPFKENSKPIGDSRHLALKRLYALERRFKDQPEKLNEYNEQLHEYLKLGHMEKVPSSEIAAKKETYYIPHHAVYKPSSTTTKVRPVFDASAKSTTRVSLNENLMVGPKLQNDLVSILLRFRQHKVALVADITKMYRQIRMNNEDADYQRIVWRKLPEHPVEDYRILTVTFGTSSAPYQAVRVLQQLAEDEKEICPEAAISIKRDMYVDDLMSGAASESQALVLQEKLIKILNLGGFDLRKWSSNSAKILEAVPPEMRETQLPMKIDTDNSIKTLGLSWNPTTDAFFFTVNISRIPAVTKRAVLSEMAKIFDPLGLLSPIIIKAKIFIQHLWKSNLDWDDILDEENKEYWKNYAMDLPAIETIRIPRFYASEEKAIFELHGYCDASEKAYAAVVYLQVTDSNKNISTTLVAGKTRVAPVKIVTLARLELCGAVLLTRLLKIVQSALSLKIENISAWTDSTIVLGWISSPSQRWKTFVSHRVAEIQDFLPINKWAHIAGKKNPADCASRGLLPSELEEFSLWWKGPQILSREKVELNESEELLSEERKSESYVFTAIIGTIDNVDVIAPLLLKYSSWEKLQRKIAYLLRFYNNIRKNCSQKRTGILSVDERNEATLVIVKKIQADEFRREITCVTQRKPLPANSRFLNLNPFMDKEGLLRVGGRLEKANVTFDKKHPLLLPKSNFVTELIIRHYHEELLHGGAQLLLSNLQEKFWIPSGRDAVRKIIRKCLTCVRLRAETAQQIMGNLPESRVNPSRPFLHCGIDYAGPFNLKNARGRNPMKYKAYIAIFICFATRAIHLEPVSDLSTETFLQTLKRFVATRGKPAEIYSDCGSNFVGAARELKELLQFFKDQNKDDAILKYAIGQEINWNFNPPSASHFGGIWEAGVKSMKFHLKRVIGNQLLNFEELLTILKQIEAVLNSRPLTDLSTDPSDIKALTPGHFLIGSALSAIPEPDLTSLKINRLSRWQMIQQMFQHFWKRWSKEHLSRLQQRPKWWSEKANIEVGNLVLIKDDRLPPLQWKMGRILEVYPGKDNLVRVVNVKTSEGELRRPIAKLCLLPIDVNM